MKIHNLQFGNMLRAADCPGDLAANRAKARRGIHSIDVPVGGYVKITY